MKESGYYPDGAEFDKRAPYNQHEPELTCEVKKIVTDYETKEITVHVDWYIDGKIWNFSDMDKYSLKEEYYFPIDYAEKDKNYFENYLNESA